MSNRGRCIKVVLLSREELTFFVEGKSKVQEVVSLVCEHLTLRETEYFGLAKLADGEYEFLEATTKFHKLLHKQPRSWRAHKQEERVSLTLYFRVQYYVEHISLLKERVTRQLYYQQLKDNLLHYAQEVSEEQCFQLAAYSLQADLGNYQHDRHATNYFDPREYFPAWIVEKRGVEYIRQNMPLMHNECHSMSRPEAYKLYIRDLSRSPLAHNMHMYRVKRHKQEEQGSVWVAVSPSGIYIYQDEGAYRTLLSIFEWKNIGRLHFEKKKFEIQPSGSDTRKFRYYTGSDDRGKHLLGLCKRSHQFQMAMAPKLAEQRHLEAEDRRYRETYIYSDIVPEPGLTALGRKLSFSRSPGRLSNASSATTSGIASERLHTSLDEHDEDTQEILINSPPQPVNRTHLPGESGCAAGSVLTALTSSRTHSPLTIASSRQSSGRSPGGIVGGPLTYPLPGTTATSSSSRQSSGCSPATTAALTGGSSISRTSSGQHSQRSNNVAAGAAAQLSCLQQPKAPNLIPADAHIQKMSFPKRMTVTSNPVVQRMGGSEINTNVYPSNQQQVNSINMSGSVLLPQHYPQQQQSSPQFAQHPTAVLSKPAGSFPKDHTYANFETLQQSQPIYTQTDPRLATQTHTGTVAGPTYHLDNHHPYSDTQQMHYPQSATHASSSYQDLAAAVAASYDVRSNTFYHQDNNNLHSQQLGYHPNPSEFERAYQQELTMPFQEVVAGGGLAYRQENMVPSVPGCSTRPPPVSRAREFIVTRPNRSYSQVTPPNKALSPPQRAVSNADAYLAKRPNRVDCPVHGILTDLYQEIKAKSSGKNLPLLAALCRDKSLQHQQQQEAAHSAPESECCCQTPDSNLKRLSYSHPSSSSTPDLYQPGSVVRPVSWHEPTNLELHNTHQQLQVFRGSINIDEHKPPNTGVSVSSNNSATLGPLSPLNPQFATVAATNPQGMILPFNGALHQSMESLDYPTMLTYSSPSQMEYHVPPRLHSLSGAQSVDNLLGHRSTQHQHFVGMGIAT